MRPRIIAFLAILALAATTLAAHSLPESFGIAKGWPLAPGAPPTLLPIRSAVSRAFVGQGFVSGLSGTYIQGQSRVRYQLAGGTPLSEIEVCYGNWAGPGEAVGPGNLTIEAALEFDGPTLSVRFTWAGQNNITLAPGATACSDALYPSAFGLTQFPANGLPWFRTGVTASASTGFPYSILSGGVGEGFFAGPAFTSQILSTGPMTTPSGGAAASAMLTPFAVTGRYAVAGMPSLCDLGDSISAGVNDLGQSVFQGEYAGNGYVGRAAYNTYGTQLYPTFKMGIGGDGIAGGATGYAQRSKFFQYCTHGVSGEGVNDLTSGTSPATILSALRTLWSTMSAAGIQYIWQTTITPYMTSTDGWLTAGSQTPVSGVYAPGGNKDQLNTLIKANVGSNNLTGYIDVGNIATGGTTDYWVNTNTQTYTPNVTVTSGSNNFTFSSGTFTTLDVGKVINITGAGPSGSTFQGHIFAVTSTTNILTQTFENAGTTLSAVPATTEYGTQPTSDGLHPLGPLHQTIAPSLTAALQSVGPQLPTIDNSWVPAGADWAIDFVNNRWYQINCAVSFCNPSVNSGAGLTTRTSAAYGVTANNSTGTLIQFEPNTPRIVPGRGLLIEKAATNLFTTPFTPATQTATVSNATQYTISVYGTGSLTLSGACTGTVSAGSPVTCTTSTTSLTATVSGTLLSMQCETGAVATSPILGSRSAEEILTTYSQNATVFQPPVSSWFATTAGTVITTIEGQVGNAFIYGNFGTYFPTSSNTTNFFANSGGTLTATYGTYSNGHTVIGGTWDASGRGLVANAGTVVTDTHQPGLSGQYLGGDGAGGGDSNLNSYVQMIVHYPTRLTGAAFQSATTP